jgi:hypothetical protein
VRMRRRRRQIRWRPWPPLEEDRTRRPAAGGRRLARWLRVKRRLAALSARVYGGWLQRSDGCPHRHSCPWLHQPERPVRPARGAATPESAVVVVVARICRTRREGKVFSGIISASHSHVALIRREVQRSDAPPRKKNHSGQEASPQLLV